MKSKTRNAKRGGRSLQRMVRRLRDNKLYVDASDEAADWIEAAAKVLQQVSDLLPGSLDGVGGGTRVSPSINVQLVKDARELVPPNDPSSATRPTGGAS